MEITINAIHFDATQKLQDFIEKKVLKLQKSYEDIKKVEVKLTVVKPATALNKQASLSLNMAGTTIFVEKTCDTFEEAIDLAVDAIKVKMTKIKEKSRIH
ncbi:MAG: ribosome hibernation-promoting factor, HPF/YfiA family [Prevotella sp.]